MQEDVGWALRGLLSTHTRRVNTALACIAIAYANKHVGRQAHTHQHTQHVSHTRICPQRPSPHTCLVQIMCPLNLLYQSGPHCAELLKKSGTKQGLPGRSNRCDE